METNLAPAQETPQASKEKEKRKFSLPRVPKKVKKWLKRGVVLAIVAGGVYWFVLRPGQSGGTPAGLAGQYVSDTVQRRDLTLSVSGTGTVTPIDSYQVRALATGEVLEAPFEEGEQVTKGQLLCRMDAGDAETSIQQARLSLRQAQKNYDDLASNLQPTASTGGVVQQVLVQKGDLVSPGTPIAEITDTSTMILTVPFHSADAQLFSVGQSAQVTLAGTMETLNGTVESIASADLVGTGGTLVRQVRVRVSNPGALTTGTSATAVVGDTACAGSGTFEENSHQTTVAQASGEVTEVHVSAGSQVTAGTALVTLGGAAVNSSLEDLSIAAENAKITLQRTQDALENYTVLAPISGTVIEKNVKAGDKIDGIESGSLAVLYDLSRLKLEMNISELDLNKLQPGQTVDITADALPGQVFQGVLEKVSINGSTTNGFTTYPATILLDEYGGLNPGMNVSADIIVEQIKDALSIPASAVQRGDTVLVPGPGAFGEDGVTIADASKVEERTVTLGGSDGTYVEITSGLNEGDVVLTPAQVGPDAGAAAVPAGG